MAAGQTLFSATALGAISPAASNATLDTRNQRPVLDFNDAADEQVYFSGVLPAHYSGGDLDIAIHWMAETATSAVCLWVAQFERLEVGGFDLDGTDFQTAVAIGTPAVSPSGELLETIITLTALDSAVAGDSFRIQVGRLGTNGADLMVGDAELLDINIVEA